MTGHFPLFSSLSIAIRISASLRHKPVVQHNHLRWSQINSSPTLVTPDVGASMALASSSLRSFRGNSRTPRHTSFSASAPELVSSQVDDLGLQLRPRRQPTDSSAWPPSPARTRTRRHGLFFVGLDSRSTTALPLGPCFHRPRLPLGLDFCFSALPLGLCFRRPRHSPGHPTSLLHGLRKSLGLRSFRLPLLSLASASALSLGLCFRVSSASALWLGLRWPRQPAPPASTFSALRSSLSLSILRPPPLARPRLSRCDAALFPCPHR